MPVPRLTLTGVSLFVALGFLVTLGNPIAEERQKAGPLTLQDLAVPFVDHGPGSTDAPRFSATTFAGGVHVTEDGEIVYALPAPGEADAGVVLRETSAASGPHEVTAGAAAPTRVSIYRGNDATRWKAGLQTCHSVQIDDIAPGISLEVAATASNVEKFFHVDPGADPSDIRMRIVGGSGLSISDDGELVVATAHGPFSFTSPVAYQDTGDMRTECPARYVVDGDSYGFQVDGFDPDLPVCIDPLIAATYLGGDRNDWAKDVAVHGDSVYVCGYTSSMPFPLNIPGDVPGYDQVLGVDGAGQDDAFIARLDTGLTTLQAVTYLGTERQDIAYGIDASDNGVFVIGETSGYAPTEFPTDIAGTGVLQADTGGGVNAFVCRLGHDLDLVESTLIGGDVIDKGIAILDTPSHGLLIGGTVRSTEFSWDPFPDGGYKPPVEDNSHVFLMRISRDLDVQHAAALFGGRASDDISAIATDGTDIVFCGSTWSDDVVLTFPTDAVDQTNSSVEGDGYVARMDMDLTTLRAFTYLGGDDTGSEFDDYPSDSCNDIALHEGAVLVCGETACIDFPIGPRGWDTTPTPRNSISNDAFVVKLNADLSLYLGGTFLGGTGSDSATGIAVHENGVVVAGGTSSADFVFPANSEDDTIGGVNDAFVIALEHDLSAPLDGRYVGGSGRDTANALARGGDAFFLVGETFSLDLVPSGMTTFEDTHSDAGMRNDGFVTGVELDLGGGTEPPPVIIEAYFLPKRLDVKPKKNYLNAGGWFDTGPDPVDFAQPATLWIGAQEFDIPGLAPAKKGWWEFGDKKNGPLFFRIKPQRTGSSKAKFKLIYKDPAVANIDLEGELTLRFKSRDVDATGTVTLKQGRFKLGRLRGALIDPPLALYNCKNFVKGDNKDSVRVRLGLSTGGGTPPQAPDVTLAFGDVAASVPGTEFKRVKDKYIYRRGGNAPGISTCRIDYGKEKFAVHTTSVELGEPPEGASRAEITLTLGGEKLTLRVRMVRKKKKMWY